MHDAVAFQNVSRLETEDCHGHVHHDLFQVLCNLQFFDSFRMYPLDIQKNIVLRGHFIA